MKTILMAATFAVFLIQPAFAQQSPAPGPDAKTQQAPKAAELDAQYAKLQEQMKQMHDQMAKIAQTKDPQEREQLLQQHWASMQSAMTTMHSTFGGMMGPGSAGQSQGGHMMNGPMMGGPMMGGHMMHRGDYRALTPDQLRERQYMMERWMPMQQMMMEQMMQHQHWMQPQAVPPPPKKQ